MSRRSLIVAAVFVWPASVAAHGDPIYLVAPLLIPLAQVAALLITAVSVALLPGVVAALASIIVAVIARASRVRLRFLIEWVIRSFVVSYAVLAAALLISGRAAADLIDASNAPATFEQSSLQWFIALQVGGWTGLAMYGGLVPIPMLALLVAFFARRRRYRAVERTPAA
jgi:hypothetical protein